MKEKITPGSIIGRFNRVSDIYDHDIYIDEKCRYVVRTGDLPENSSENSSAGFLELKKLRDTYGISMPKYASSNRAFITTSESKPRALAPEGKSVIVAEYVEGFSLGSRFSVSSNDMQAFRHNADLACMNLARYFLDSYQLGEGYYLSELSYVQFMYARPKLDPNMRMMLVDIEPYTKRLVSGEDPTLFFQCGPEKISEMILHVEGEIRKRLDRARAELQKFVSIDSSRGLRDKNVVESTPNFKRILEGRGII